MKKAVFYFLLLNAFVFTLVGCNTLRGAGEGAKKDWQTLKDWDKEFQEKYW